MRDYAHVFSLTMLLVLVGLLAGVLAGLFGIGGGLIIVPAMTFLLLAQGHAPELAVPTAIATSLASMLLTSASAVWAHHKKIGIDRLALGALAPGIMLGAGVGVWLAVHLPTVWLSVAFAIVASLVGVQMALSYTPKHREDQAKPRAAIWVGPLIGSISSMVGIGGGSMLVPYLVWNGYPAVRAVAIASAVGWLLALMATLTFVVIERQLVALGPIVSVGVAGWLAAPVGVWLAHRLSSTRLRRLFGLMLVVVALRLFWQIHTTT